MDKDDRGERRTSLALLVFATVMILVSVGLEMYFSRDSQTAQALVGTSTSLVTALAFLLWGVYLRRIKRNAGIAFAFVRIFLIICLAWGGLWLFTTR